MQMGGKAATMLAKTLTEEVVKVVRKGLDEAFVQLHRRAAMEQGLIVAAEAQALAVARA